MQPKTGRVLLEAAPWKGHDGFCYLVLRARAGCVRRTGQTVILTPPLFGWTFDRRVRSGTATTIGGKGVPLTVQHFGGRIGATFFLIRDRLPRLLRERRVARRRGARRRTRQALSAASTSSCNRPFVETALPPSIRAAPRRVAEASSRLLDDHLERGVVPGVHLVLERRSRSRPLRRAGAPRSR